MSEIVAYGTAVVIEKIAPLSDAAQRAAHFLRWRLLAVGVGSARWPGFVRPCP